MTLPKGYKPPNKSEVSPNNISKNTHCNKCGKDNLENAIFCNQCGSPLLFSCSNCGNSTNLQNASFCNQCGLKIQTNGSKGTLTNSSIEKNHLNNNFLQHIIPEHNIKVDYPFSWLKFDKLVPDLLVMFKPLKENMSDTFPEMVGLTVKDSMSGSGVNLKEHVEANIENMKANNSDFALVEYSPTTLGGIPAYQLIYTTNSLKHLFVMSIRGNKEYYVGYIAEPERYLTFLSVVEQIISSFEFIP